MQWRVVAVKSHERPSVSSRSRSRTGSSRSHGQGRSRTGERAGAYGYAPQKPYRPPTLGMAESSNTEGEERMNLCVRMCLCQRMESSYIGADERRREWTWTLLTTIIPIKWQLPVTAVFNVISYQCIRITVTTSSAAARRASARACGTPFSFYQLHKWSTVGPPFKLVKILIGFQCGIESLAFILWTF
jgi:hypothetical protein